jgi:low molecular weight protein-tyrosine phosphatase
LLLAVRRWGLCRRSRDAADRIEKGERDVRSDGFEVVFVCTGNQARSPLAEMLLRQRLDAGSVQVRSVGTRAVGPVPAHPGAVRAARLVGASLAEHRARPLRVHELVGADLVVGFEPEHISAAVIDGRADAAKTFSLIELGEILEGLRGALPAPPQPALAIKTAHSRRTTGFLSAPALADPYGGSDEVFRRTLESIDRHVETIADVVFGVAPRLSELSSK